MQFFFPFASLMWDLVSRAPSQHLGCHNSDQYGVSHFSSQIQTELGPIMELLKVMISSEEKTKSLYMRKLARMLSATYIMLGREFLR